MAVTIPGYLDARQAADRLELSVGTVYNLNSLNNDFPSAVYIGRTPLWPVDQLDSWRAEHPSKSRGDVG